MIFVEQEEEAVVALNLLEQAAVETPLLFAAFCHYSFVVAVVVVVVVVLLILAILFYYYYYYLILNLQLAHRCVSHSKRMMNCWTMMKRTCE